MEGFGQTETTMTWAPSLGLSPNPGRWASPTTVCIRPQVGRHSLQDGEKAKSATLPAATSPMGSSRALPRRGADREDLVRRYLPPATWRGDDEDGYYWFVGRAMMTSRVRATDRPVRGGECAVDPPCRGGVCRDGCARCRARHDCQGTIVLAKDWKDKADDELVKQLQQQ
jgi:acetyl-CoA synthetase